MTEPKNLHQTLEKARLALAHSVDMVMNAEIAKGLLQPEEKEELIKQLSMLAFNMTDAGEKSTNLAQAAGWLFHLRHYQLPSWRKKMLNLTTDTEPHATPTEHQQATTKLKQAQDCGLITNQNGEIKFAQPWLQEYFCALFLQKQELNKEWLSRLVNSPIEEFWPMWSGMDNTLVDRLLVQLQASDNKERLIIIALGKIGDPRAVEPLLQTLKDQNGDAHYLATKALGKIGDTRALEPLILALNTGDDFLRSFAAEALGQIGDTRAVEPLIQALKDESWDVHRAAVSALGKISGARAVERLILALKDEESKVRSAAASVLGLIGGTRATEPLILALKDENVDVRSHAAEALGKIGDGRAIEPLILALKEEDSDVRRIASYALGDIADPRAIEPLILALQDENDGVRSASASALREIGDTRAVEPLILALKDEDVDVRCKVANMLGEIGDGRALPELETVAREDKEKTIWNESVSDIATEAIEKIKARQQTQS